MAQGKKKAKGLELAASGGKVVAPHILDDSQNTVEPIREEMVIPVTSERSVHISGETATEFRAAVLLAMRSNQKYRELWPRIEDIFGPNAFQKKTPEYAAAVDFVARVNPLWKAKPARRDTSEQAKRDRDDRKYCQTLAQQAMSRMIGYRDEADESNGGTRGKGGTYQEWREATVKRLKRMAEDKKRSETERNLATRDLAALQFAERGVFRRLVALEKQLPVVVAQHILLGIPKELPQGYSMSDNTPKETKPIGADVEPPMLPEVAQKRTVGAEGKKAGRVTIKRGKDAQAEAKPEAKK